MKEEDERTMGLERIQKMPLTDRLKEFAQDARDKAEKLEPGPEREELLKKARKAETASELEAWANGLRMPK